MVIQSNGGGGYGNPLERDPEKVKNDVLNEYVSMTAAQERYGVVMNRQSLQVDYERARSLRREMEQVATLPKTNVT